VHEKTILVMVAIVEEYIYHHLVLIKVELSPLFETNFSQKYKEKQFLWHNKNRKIYYAYHFLL
jgi:hypothetical protein